MDHFKRALFLMNNSRIEEAERELRATLASEPGNAYAYALLSTCLLAQERVPEAVAQARSAIAHDPHEAFCHYRLSLALIEAERFREALAAASEAIRLDPDDPDYYVQKASAHLSMNQWEQALEAAEWALGLDAEHQSALNLRAVSLRQLGRSDHAASVIDGALARQPDDARTLANKGWQHIDHGEFEEARTIFMAALRIEPNNEWARDGLLEVLKAKNFFYRGLLNFQLWLGKQSGQTVWAIIIGGFFLSKGLRSLENTYPALQPFILPILIVYYALVLFTWLAPSISNLVLRFHPLGKNILNRHQKNDGLAFGIALATGTTLLTLYLITKQDALLLPLLWTGILVIPITRLLGTESKRRARALKPVVYGMTLLALASLSLSLIGEIKWANAMLGLGFLSFIGFQFYSNYLGTRSG